MLYRVHVSWTVCGTIEVEANTEEEAIKKAYDSDLPNGEYLDDSFDIDEIEEV